MYNIATMANPTSEKIAFTQFPVKEIFETPTKGTELHHLLAKGDPSALSRLASAKIEELNAADPIYRLTPLAVAAMTSNEQAAALLVRRGVDPLPLDHKRWTPLHYLTVAPNPAIEKLVKKAALSQRRAMPQLDEIRRMLNAHPPAATAPVAELKDQNGMKTITAKQFQELTDYTFCEEPSTTPEGLIDQWRQEQGWTDQPQMPAFYSDCLKAYRRNPPKLYLDENGSVYTRTPCEPYQIIAIHGGEFPLSSFQVPQKIANMGSLIGDGFPNCYMEQILVDGIPMQVIFSLQKLKAGEKLTYDYGEEHPIKFEYQPLSQETKDYYLTHSLQEMFREIQSICPTEARPQDVLRRRGQISKLRYVVNNQYVLVSLLLERGIDTQTLTEVLLRQPKNLKSLGLSVPGKKLFREMLDVYAKILLHMGALPPSIENKVKDFIFSVMRSFPLHIFLRMMQSLGKEIESVKDLPSWRKVHSEMKKRILLLTTFLGWIAKNKTDDELEERLSLTSEKTFNAVRETLDVVMETATPERRAALQKRFPGLLKLEEVLKPLEPLEPFESDDDRK